MHSCACALPVSEGRSIARPFAGKGTIRLKYLMVGIGGAIGSVLRFWLGSYLGSKLGGRFPYGTFVVNISGSFLIGVVITMFAERMQLSANWRYLIPIGLIGGYTTFSAFEYETFRLFQDGEILIAALNVVLSVIVGFAGVWGGAIVGKSIPLHSHRTHGFFVRSADHAVDSPKPAPALSRVGEDGE
jgi:CrcB protein